MDTLSKGIRYNKNDVVIEFFKDAGCTEKIATWDESSGKFTVAYGWLNGETMEIQYGSNGMPDIGANEMFYNATRRGGIETMPDTPGLAVWKPGHIGVYIGNGEVIEAMGTKYGVVKTQLEGRGWTHWLEIPYIKYD